MTHLIHTHAHSCEPSMGYHTTDSGQPYLTSSQKQIQMTNSMTKQVTKNKSHQPVQKPSTEQILRRHLKRQSHQELVQSHQACRLQLASQPHKGRTLKSFCLHCRLVWAVGQLWRQGCRALHSLLETREKGIFVVMNTTVDLGVQCFHSSWLQ